MKSASDGQLFNPRVAVLTVALGVCLLYIGPRSVKAAETAPHPAPTPAPDPDKEKPVTAGETNTSAKQPKHTNRLAKETSPYLLQHQHNPVDWYPWGDEAFEKARKENKPIFLSVGYSSCHWCHVMEHQSFEHEDVGALLNKHFVSIKVDREERPDVDDLYMKFVHLTGQQGGWPMSVLMTPEGAPFFAGTYFPKPSFIQLLNRVNELWTTEREQIEKDAARAAAALREQADAEYKPPERGLSVKTVERSVAMLDEYFDHVEGGMRGGGARTMKFPPHTALALLVHAAEMKVGDAAAAQKMATLTFDKMRLGGIHDHLGGGFHRYATDGIWFLPHFEKMLYDNAQLARNYARAAKVFGRETYAETARDTLDWVLREMTDKGGAFYSAYDADSEGEEGKFYVWDEKEVRRLLGDEADLFCEIYGIREGGNFHDEATRQPTGLNIPHLSRPLAEEAAARKLKVENLRAKLDACRAKLMAVRNRRVWPGLDDKILLSWNGLMVGAFAKAGQELDEKKYVDAAVRAAEWLIANMRNDQGRWFATHRAGQSKLAAYLDDHAYLANAFMDLHDATGEQRWLDEARALVKLMDEHFWDEKRGGYFLVADDHEKLLVRMRNPNDNATPSGNGIAAQALVRLAKATGDDAYADRAADVFRAFHTLMDLAPVQVESMVLALAWYFEQGRVIKGGAVRRKAKIARGSVEAELLVGRDKLNAGQRVPIAVRLRMKDGWHVHAHVPSHEQFVATAIALESEDLGKLEDVVYPAHVKLEGGDLGELHVYAGEILLKGWLNVPADAPLGERMLEVEAAFQACNHDHCEMPQAPVLGLVVEVVGPEAPSKALHNDIFGGSKASKK